MILRWLLIVALAVLTAPHVLAITHRSSSAIQAGAKGRTSALATASSTCLYPCVHGNCVNGACRCKKGWVGVDCAARGCTNNCNGKGYCDLSVIPECLCFPGYWGAACENDASIPLDIQPVTEKNIKVKGGEVKKLPKDKTRRNPKYFKICAPDCGENGVCVEGKCLCANPHWGTHCQFMHCPSDCSGRGSCDFHTGVCDCYHPFNGTACELGQPLPRQVYPEETAKVIEYNVKRKKSMKGKI